jgi:thiol-disulfide isomerase/thioredoxin
MKSNALITILLIAVIGGGAVLALNNKNVKDKMEVDEQVMMKDEAMLGEDKMMEEEVMAEDDKMMMADRVGYLDYDEESFEEAKDKKRVLFFYANWCPTCRPVDKEINEKVQQIPEDTVVFKVDYDTEDELKEKYVITYQHTFVYVDETGAEISKWNGGDFGDILEKTK